MAYLYGNPSTVATELRKRVSSTSRVQVSWCDDEVVWSALLKDPSFSGPVEVGEVVRAWERRRGERNDLTIFVFVRHGNLDAVVHFRPRAQMRELMSKALVDSVLRA